MNKLIKYINLYVIALLSIFFILSMVGFYNVFYKLPEDYLHKDLVKIMYIHVPSAWSSIILYCLVVACSVIHLVYKNPLYWHLAGSISHVGFIATVITLITGSFWGFKAWGTWWVWDVRLTSVLILMFIYLIYIVLRSNFENENRNASVSSVFAIIGLINIPVIKFSVYLWNSLHQKSTFFSFEGPKIHESMLYPLIIIAISIFALNFSLILLDFKVNILKLKNRRL